MKTKTYTNGKNTGRAYCKNVGNGFEVGFTYCGKTIFIGNFIHAAEASRWYSLLNNEVKTFNRTFKVGPSFSRTWYTHFMTANLYKKYYAFLGKVFVAHTRKYNQAVTRNVRKYRQLNRNWYPSEKTVFLKAA